MKFAIVLALIVCATASSLFNVELNGEWELFKVKHGKTYRDYEEEGDRRLKWERNLKLINKHNAEADNGVHTYRLGMNQLGDMTTEEINRKLNGFKPQLASRANAKLYQPTNNSVPDSVDWRTQGYVTPVKDQGQCGSCWAFSTTGSLEGQHFKATGQLVSLSEQNLVDCSGNTGNMGCFGGLMDQAFQYIKLNNGLDTEASYPYEAVNANCRFNAANVGATDSGYTDIQSGNEDALVNAIATVGPISVAIDASQYSFHFYSSGVYYEPQCSSIALDHGVLAVGYGADATGQQYYIVKNSWASTWGDNGFIMMSRNRDNNCGIATMSSFPLV